MRNLSLAGAAEKRAAWVFVLMAGLVVAAWPAPAAASDAYAEVAALNAQLRARPSATETLEDWCAARHLADPPTVVAERAHGVDKPATAEVRRLLRVRRGEAIGYRRVALACGGRVLSNADNWYVPDRLTPAMNRELQTTDHPFGLVVKALRFHRRRLASQILVRPHARRIPQEVLRHRALLETPDGTPFSFVVETYDRGVLDEGPALASARQ